MATRRSMSSAFITIFALLATRSFTTTDALNTCVIGCLASCIGSELILYPVCVLGCLITSCRTHPPAAANSVPDPLPSLTLFSDPAMQCNIGCVTSNCMSGRHPDEAKDENAQKCVTSCAASCDRSLAKKS